MDWSQRIDVFLTSGVAMLLAGCIADVVKARFLARKSLSDSKELSAYDRSRALEQEGYRDLWPPLSEYCVWLSMLAREGGYYSAEGFAAVKDREWKEAAKAHDTADIALGRWKPFVDSRVASLAREIIDTCPLNRIRRFLTPDCVPSPEWQELTQASDRASKSLGEIEAIVRERIASFATADKRRSA